MVVNAQSHKFTEGCSRVFYINPPIEKRQLWVRPIEWLKLNVGSCVIRQTRPLGALVLYYIPFVICNIYAYHIIIWCLWFKSTILWLLLILSSISFMVSRSRMSCEIPGTKHNIIVFYHILNYSYERYRSVTPLAPGCYQGQQGDFTRTVQSITILRT